MCIMKKNKKKTLKTSQLVYIVYKSILVGTVICCIVSTVSSTVFQYSTVHRIIASEEKIFNVCIYKYRQS